MGLIEEYFNDFLSNIEIMSVHSESIELSGKYIEDWDCVLFLLEYHLGQYY